MIIVCAYEGEDLITRKEFPTLTDACAWIMYMGIDGVNYTIKY